MSDSDTDSWVDVNSHKTKDVQKDTKLIYADLKSLGIRHVQTTSYDEVVLPQLCKKCNKTGAKFINQDNQFFCQQHMQGLCVDYLDTVYFRLNDLMQSFAHKICIMLLYKNCPCDPKEREQVLDLYAVSKAELIEINNKYLELISSSDFIDFNLIEFRNEINALIKHMTKFPANPEFEAEAEKMIPSILETWIHKDTDKV